VPPTPAVRRLTLLLLVLAPWAWFLVRDAWAPLNAVAVVLPALGLAFAVAAIVMAIARRRAGWLAVAVSIGLATTWAITEPRLAQDSPAPSTSFRIAFGNVYDDNHDPEAAADDLVERGSDVVVAVEAVEGFRDAIEKVDTVHPDAVDDGQLLVRARWPVELLDPPAALPDGRALLARVHPPDTEPVTFLVLHMENPSSATTFTSQVDQVATVMRIATRLAARGPLVVVGDLNLSDRTTGYRELSSTFRDAMRAGAFAHNTYAGGAWRFAMLRIDHLFLSRSWCALDPDVFTIEGSDHRGIEVTVGPCP
jgi:endonuclease/exonuclease/phosphatase (EEP) superfamily protein YafD